MRIIGIGEYFISRNPDDIIKTYSLGSCVALTIHCPKRKVSGMAHIALPSPQNVSEAYFRPAHFAETAVPLMLKEFCNIHGCKISDLMVGIYGGALAMRENDVFRIGQKNVNAIFRSAADNGIIISRNETGGNCSRTVELDVATGTVRIESQPMII